MSRNNLAYKVNPNTTRETKNEEEKKLKVAVQKNEAHNGSPFKVILTCAFVGVLLFSVIYCKAETNNLYSNIAEANAELTISNSENVRMQTEIDGRLSTKKVEEYAENVLGLEKINKSQIQYVQIQEENVVDIPNENNNIFVQIKDWFNNLVEYIFA